MNQATNFELCSYSTLSEKCDAYGARFCKTCDRYFCDDHRCMHIIAFDSVDVQGYKERENETDVCTSVGYSYYTTTMLRDKRDRLFLQLKEIQRELDLREDSAAAIARETSEANLDNWLKEQGYGERASNRRTSTRSTSRRTHNFSRKRIQRTDKSTKESSFTTCQRALETIFKGFSQEQIKIFVSKYTKEK